MSLRRALSLASSLGLHGFAAAAVVASIVVSPPPAHTGDMPRLTWAKAVPPLPPPPPAAQASPPVEPTGYRTDIAPPDEEIGFGPVADTPPAQRIPGGISGCGGIGGIVAGLAEMPLSPLHMPTILDVPLAAAPLRAGVDLPAPAKLVDAAPRYPSIARVARLEGVVVLDATIDEHGAVVDVRLLRSVPPFDRAAADAVRQWRYAPATLHGLPTRVVLTVTVSFRL